MTRELKKAPVTRPGLFFAHALTFFEQEIWRLADLVPLPYEIACTICILSQKASRMLKVVSFAMLVIAPHLALAQGQDSTTWARDRMVIGEMLPGVYSNANQVYFDTRTAQPDSARRGPLTVTVTGLPEAHSFTLEAAWNGADKPAWHATATLGLDDAEGRVTMTVTSGEGSCDYAWRREATQFEAELISACAQPRFNGMVLSEPQLWLTGTAEPGGDRTLDYVLHGGRPFECYVDVPGVGGGRDEPYRRYDGFKIHDRGGQFWFTTEDDNPRELGVTLFQVDWPLNNYEGIFTRDTLVIYLNERKDGLQINHGYGFTVPDADRVGINLKWALAFCYQVAGKDQRPYM